MSEEERTELQRAQDTIINIRKMAKIALGDECESYGRTPICCLPELFYSVHETVELADEYIDKEMLQLPLEEKGE